MTIRSYRECVRRRKGRASAVITCSRGLSSEPEEAAAGCRHGRVELDPVDAGLRVEDAERPRGRPACVAEDRNPAERPAEQGRNGEVRVPLAAGQHRVAAPDRMHGEPFVQVQAAHAVLLGDVDELVAGLVLVDEARLGSDGAGRNGEQRRDRGGDDEPAAPEQRARPEAPRPRRREQGALRADRGNRDERREERPQRGCRPSRARTAAPRPCPPSRTSSIASRTANGATMPSSVTGGAKSASTAKNEPIAAPAET